VDEVLAVGDATFQKKCLGKMGEVSRGGRTVIFISHSMATVENLCRKGVLLAEGKVVFSGDMKDTVDRYLHSVSAKADGSPSHIVDLTRAAGRPPRCAPLLKRLELFTDQGRPLVRGLRMGSTLKAYIHFNLEEPTASLDASLGFNNLLGQRVFTAHSVFEPQRSWGERIGRQVFVCEIPSLTLVPGDYKIKVALNIHNFERDYVEDAALLTILESDYYGTGKVPWNGVFVLHHRWQLNDDEQQ
jgi:lipopolysaccharide transport system ATP-binding protein